MIEMITWLWIVFAASVMVLTMAVVALLPWVLAGWIAWFILSRLLK